MNITSSPAPFASAVEPLLYTLEGLDPDTITTVEIVNADNGSTLGRLRLRGVRKRSIDVAPYLRRHFVLAPTINSATYAISHYASVINHFIRIGEVQSEVVAAVLAAPQFSPLVPNRLLSELPLHRTLAAGENDDLRLISIDGTISAAFRLYDADGSVTPYSISTSEREQVVGVVVDFNTLQARVSAPLKRIEVTLSTSAGEVATLVYDVVRRGAESCRVAWSNALGGCDLFTFEGFGARKVSFERSRGVGSPVPITTRRTTLTLDSGIVSRTSIEALMSIIASPSVWIIDQRHLREVEVITTDYSTRQGECPDRLVAQLGYSETISRTI